MLYINPPSLLVSSFPFEPLSPVKHLYMNYQIKGKSQSHRAYIYINHPDRFRGIFLDSARTPFIHQPSVAVVSVVMKHIWEAASKGMTRT